MLTDEEVDELRGKVAVAAGRSDNGLWYRYADGPLRGLLTRLTPDGSQYLHGWCQPTPTGPTVVLYSTDHAKRLCHFHHFSLPGRDPTCW